MNLKNAYLLPVHTLAAMVLARMSCAVGFEEPEIGENPVLLRYTDQVQELACATPEGLVLGESFAQKCGFTDVVPAKLGMVLVKYPAEALASAEAAMVWARNLVITLAPLLAAHHEHDADFGEGKNVMVELMYRDASNFKAHGEAVIAGPVANPGILALLHHAADHEDNDFIIPGQIGLPDLQNSFNEGQAQWDDDRDHPWHELHAVFLTDDEPTVEITWPVLQEKLVDFIVGKDKWNENHRPDGYEDMVKRRSEAVKAENLAAQHAVAEVQAEEIAKQRC